MAGASALAVFVAGACRDVVAGDAQDVASELCAVLEDCTSRGLRCPDAVADRFTEPEAAPGVRASFLEHHARHDCVATCSSARVCRDMPPLCEPLGALCEKDEDCCGSTRGAGACLDGSCCGPPGTPCDAGTPCCNGEACVDGRCGGFFCQDISASCVKNIECCSRACDEGACVANVCSELGEGCIVDGDCCGEDGAPALVCDSGRCENATDTCNACVPISGHPLNCCEPSGSCVVAVDGQTFCDDSPCASPPGVRCGSESDCCAGNVCDGLEEDDPNAHCCAPPGGSCQFDIQCCGTSLCDELAGVCAP